MSRAPRDEEEEGAYHDLLRFGQSELEGLLEGLDDHAHALRGEGKARMGKGRPLGCVANERSRWGGSMLTELRICGGDPPSSWRCMGNSACQLGEYRRPGAGIVAYFLVAWGRSSLFSSWVRVWKASVWPVGRVTLPLPRREMAGVPDGDGMVGVSKRESRE